MHTFPEILQLRARQQPDDVVYRFYQGGSLLPETLTTRQLFEQAGGMAAALQAQHLAGERILLVCRSQRYFVIAFYACMLAGAIAVPTAPPRRQLLLSRLQLLVDDAQPRAVLADHDDVLSIVGELRGGDIRSIDLRELAVPSARHGIASLHATPQQIAFLQYTSGSTDRPKGVMVSHSNLVHNCQSICEAMHISARSAILTALPLFHDMGLIGGVLVAMLAGCTAAFLPPAEFVQYPERWLSLIGRDRITHSGGPNYMFDLIARTVADEQLPGCDLSGWEVAFCGAEPIRPATIARFTQRFGALGFRASAFYPCYGMAEATLLVTGHSASSPPLLSADGVVSCGRPPSGTEIAIVDPESLEMLPAGRQGEIWVRGGGVAQGYWGRPELTAAMFGASTAGDTAARYLRTGDLGYVSAGNLYVSGRLKDLIIAYGRNHAPQDLEDAAEQGHAALCVAGAAAFNVDRESGSHIVLVCEVRREWLRQPAAWPAITGGVRSAVLATRGVQLDDVVLIRPGALPRTSSGKVQRKQCRSDYIAGALATLQPARTD